MRVLLLAGIALSLAGCASAKWTPPPAVSTAHYTLSDTQAQAVEAAVRYKMKDPASAMFRNVSAVKRESGEVSACGEVNSKNSFGAYGGFSPFIATLQGQSVTGTTISYDADSALTIAKSCSAIGAGK